MELTPEQEAMLDVYVERWTAIGHSCEPADKPLAEKWLRVLWEQEKLGPLTAFHWFPSPHAALAGAKKIAAELELPAPKKSDAWFGHHDAGWWSMHAYHREVIGLIEETEDAVPFIELCKCTGWIWRVGPHAIMADRPESIHLDRDGQLHHTSQLALRYRDGNGAACIHGTLVPHEWVLETDKVKPGLALTHPNLEQRSALAQILGWKRILEGLPHRVIDTDWGDGGETSYGFGQLIEVDLPDAPSSRFLRVRWGKGQEAVLGVPATAKTAREANASTYGWDEAVDGPFRPRNRT